MKKGQLIPNSAGLVTTTLAAAGVLFHTPSGVATATNSPVTARIKLIMWSNNTGGNGTIIFGTHDNGVPTFIPLLPTITCINGFDGVLRADELPEVIFALNRTLTPNGRDGLIYVLASAAGILLRCTIEEI